MPLPHVKLRTPQTRRNNLPKLTEAELAKARREIAVDVLAEHVEGLHRMLIQRRRKPNG